MCSCALPKRSVKKSAHCRSAARTVLDHGRGEAALAAAVALQAGLARGRAGRLHVQLLGRHVHALVEFRRQRHSSLLARTRPPRLHSHNPRAADGVFQKVGTRRACLHAQGTMRLAGTLRTGSSALRVRRYHERVIDHSANPRNVGECAGGVARVVAHPPISQERSTRLRDRVFSFFEEKADTKRGGRATSMWARGSWGEWQRRAARAAKFSFSSFPEHPRVET